MMYLGHDQNFWLELSNRFQNRPNSLKEESLLIEVVALRSRINYYESRIKEMNDVRVSV